VTVRGDGDADDDDEWKCEIDDDCNDDDCDDAGSDVEWSVDVRVVWG